MFYSWIWFFWVANIKKILYTCSIINVAWKATLTIMSCITYQLKTLIISALCIQYFVMYVLSVEYFFIVCLNSWQVTNSIILHNLYWYSCFSNLCFVHVYFFTALIIFTLLKEYTTYWKRASIKEWYNRCIPWRKEREPARRKWECL